jgi:hypothetical protein
MAERMSDEELRRFLQQDLPAANPELEGVDLLPALHAAMPKAPARRPRPAAVRPPAPRRKGPTLPANDGKGKPRLFLELYWGDDRQHARSFGTIPARKPLLGGTDDLAPMPLWGFALPLGTVRLADQRSDSYRVFVPPGAALEVRGTDGQFHSAEITDRYVKLSSGDAVRFSSGDSSLVAYVQPPLPRPWFNPLKNAPLLAIGLVVLFLGLFFAFAALAPSEDVPDFTGKNLSPVAVRLIAPEPKKKEEAKKKLESLKKQAPKKVPTAVAVAKPQAIPKAAHIKALEKLSAAGPAMKDLLAAVDKLGGGPGKKDSKVKMSDLLGKAPLSTAGIGTFGLGGGGKGGIGTQGLETLRGKGGGGIGALGAGNIGKGAVGGTVGHVVAHNLGASGAIDREAVAKVINSHLAEVSACYERALLREPGLAGKIVLEWGISVSGVVTTAKTKSSTMKSSAVEGCILTALKGWKFPPAKGAGVVISYPFLFNSVGF